MQTTNKKMFKLTPGFTLVEIIVVLAIIVILASISIPLYLSYIDKAQEGVLEANTLQIKSIVTAYSLEFDKAHWHGSWNADNEETLNNFLELNWEVIINDEHSNNSGFINPYSKKTSVVDYDSTLGAGDGYRPAIFMTDTEAYSHDGDGNTNNIIGSIVIYFDVEDGVTDHIEFYYVKKDGSKSELLGVLD